MRGFRWRLTMGQFNAADVQVLLVACHRCCCICHRFCGVKIEMDHIVPQAEGGEDTSDNAIPVCFECHAEIHSYNPKHPRGRKFQPEELRGHRDQWIAVCKERPEIFRRSSIAPTPRPLQALIDELEFNETVTSSGGEACPFKDEQFREAIRSGSISILRDEIKKAINQAYVEIGRVNQLIDSAVNQVNPNMREVVMDRAKQNAVATREMIRRAKEQLLTFLSSES